MTDGQASIGLPGGRGGACGRDVRQFVHSIGEQIQRQYDRKVTLLASVQCNVDGMAALLLPEGMDIYPVVAQAALELPPMLSNVNTQSRTALQTRLA